MKMLAAVALAIFSTVALASPVQADKDALYSAIRQVTDREYAERLALPSDAPRDPDVTSDVRPIVSGPILADLAASTDLVIRFATLPDGSGQFPDGTTKWELRGNIYELSREIIFVYTAEDYCSARYRLIN